MNQRIKNLADRALDKVVPYTWTTLNYDEIQKLQEHLAQLIVAECIATVKKRYIGDNNREDMEVRRCVADIQTHFGVEQ